ncbi:ISAs1 family transposase, partial [Arthrobacter sp. LAPM80]
MYIVTSLTPSQGKPAEIGAWIRGHWAIENGLHYRRDVLFREDHSQVRNGEAPRVMASLRNIAITILRLQGETNLAKATRGARNYPDRALKLAGIT